MKLNFFKKLQSVEKPGNNTNYGANIINIEKSLQKVNELAHIINTTLNREIFEQSLIEIKKELSYLKEYEGKINFSNSTPSQDLKRIEQNESLTRQKFEERVIESGPLQKASINYLNENITIVNPDSLLRDAGILILGREKASIGMLQRFFKIGFNRANNIVNQLEIIGAVGKESGTNPRKILMTKDQFEYVFSNNVTFINKEEESENNYFNAESSKKDRFFQNEAIHESIIKSLGISIDYSREELYYSICNCIICNSQEQISENFITSLISHTSPQNVKLILIDTGLSNYLVYNGIDNLLIPVVSEREKMAGTFAWILAEMQDRAHRFASKYVKDLDSYNKKSETSLPRIIVVVDEYYNIMNFESETLIKILLNSSRMGIHIVFFSKFESKFLSLGPKADLLKIYTEDEFMTQFINNNDIHLQNEDFDNMNGHKFENFCASILQKNGFSNVGLTKESGDQGLDIIAYKDGVKYGIQCKCYSQDIGNKAVQEAFSGAKFYDCHVPVVLTNRCFTSSAKELALKNNVLLWDRKKLLEFVSNSHKQ